MTLITNHLNILKIILMCDGIDPDSNIHNNVCVDSLYYTESEFKEHFEFKQKGSSSFSLIHLKYSQ